VCLCVYKHTHNVYINSLPHSVSHSRAHTHIYTNTFSVSLSFISQSLTHTLCVCLSVSVSLSRSLSLSNRCNNIKLWVSTADTDRSLSAGFVVRYAMSPGSPQLFPVYKVHVWFLTSGSETLMSVSVCTRHIRQSGRVLPLVFSVSGMASLTAPPVGPERELAISMLACWMFTLSAITKVDNMFLKIMKYVSGNEGELKRKRLLMW